MHLALGMMILTFVAGAERQQLDATMNLAIQRHAMIRDVLDGMCPADGRLDFDYFRSSIHVTNPADAELADAFARYCIATRRMNRQKWHEFGRPIPRVSEMQPVYVVVRGGQSQVSGVPLRLVGQDWKFPVEMLFVATPNQSRQSILDMLEAQIEAADTVGRNLAFSHYSSAPEAEEDFARRGIDEFRHVARRRVLESTAAAD